MSEVDLTRLHGRLDSLLAELSKLSQRVARSEVKESRVEDNAKDIDKLEVKCEALAAQIASMGVSIAKLGGEIQALKNAPDSSQGKSKVKDYAERGGLVVSGGAVVELVRWVLELIKASG